MTLVRNVVAIAVSLMCSTKAMALTSDELEKGVSEALSFSTANSALAIYVSGYVTGSVNSALSVGLACVDKDRRFQPVNATY